MSGGYLKSLITTHMPSTKEIPMVEILKNYDSLKAYEVLHKKRLFYGRIPLGAIFGVFEDGHNETSLRFKLANVDQLKKLDNERAYQKAIISDIRDLGHILLVLYIREFGTKAQNGTIPRLECQKIGNIKPLILPVHDAKLLDLIMLCFRFYRDPLKIISMLLEHPLFTSDTLNVDSDQFGKRRCQVRN